MERSALIDCRIATDVLCTGNLPFYTFLEAHTYSLALAIGVMIGPTYYYRIPCIVNAYTGGG